VNFSSSAPAREPLPETPDREVPGTPLAPEEQEGRERTLARLRLLWQHRVLLSRVVVCALLASTLVAFLISPRYETTARLMPPDQSGSGLAMVASLMSGTGGGSSGGGGGGLAGMAGDLLGLKSTSDVFVGVLSSRTMQDKLIQQFDLKKLYGDRRMEDARNDLADHTTISVDRKSQIISVKVRDKSPERAAAMAQAYVEELNHLMADLSTSSARRERIFLEGRLQGVNYDLEAAEKDFSEFASKNTAIDVKEQGKAMVEAAAMLQGQLIAAQSQYEGLREIYTDNNPRVRSIRARIDELQRQLEKMGGKGESTTTLSNQPSDSMYPSIRKLPLLAVNWADLYRRTRIQEAVLEALTKEYEMAKVQEAKEIPTVKVLDSAHIPDKKYFPPRFAFIVLGTILGLGFAIAWVLGNEAWRETDAKDPRKLFAQEVFATVTARIPVFAKNGSGEHSSNGSAWRRLRSGKGDGDGGVKEV
jgi:capsule polysaccharide export protein KpsE/RkpR